MKPRRVGKSARAGVGKGGDIASGQGTATAAPMPRSSARREIGWMLISLGPSLILYVPAAPQAERIAFYDLDHERGEPVLVLRQGRQRLVERAVVVGLDPPAERVDRHLLEHAAGEEVLLGEDRL